MLGLSGCFVFVGDFIVVVWWFVWVGGLLNCWRLGNWFECLF